MLDPTRAVPNISVGYEYPALSRHLEPERVFPLLPADFAPSGRSGKQFEIRPRVA